MESQDREELAPCFTAALVKEVSVFRTVAFAPSSASATNLAEGDRAMAAIEVDDSDP